MEIASANSRAPAVLFRRHARCKDVDAIPVPTFSQISQIYGIKEKDVLQ